MLRGLLAVVALWANAACDDGPGFGSGLDDGTLEENTCEQDGDYPDGPHYWDLFATAPPTRFDGHPKNLDLQSIYCLRGAIKSLVFVLGAPG
jgi:hypothetical protein